jgi:hypothetical protein
MVEWLAEKKVCEKAFRTDDSWADWKVVEMDERKDQRKAASKEPS